MKKFYIISLITLLVLAIIGVLFIAEIRYFTLLAVLVLSLLVIFVVRTISRLNPKVSFHFAVIGLATIRLLGYLELSPYDIVVYNFINFNFGKSLYLFIIIGNLLLAITTGVICLYQKENKLPIKLAVLSALISLASLCFVKIQYLGRIYNDCSNPQGLPEQYYCHPPELEKYADPQNCLKLNKDKDTCYALAARYLLDETLCEKIERIPVKDDCNLDVAVIKSSTDLCDKAFINSNSGDPKGACYGEIGKKTKNSSYCEKAGSSGDNCYISVTFSTRNASLCSFVKVERLQECCDAAKGIDPFPIQIL